MNLLLSSPSTDQLLWLAAFVAALVVIWVMLRVLLKLALRIFAFGCVAIVIIALSIYLLYVMGIAG